MKVLVDKDYGKLLNEVKQKIQAAKIQVARSVNTDLIMLYFNIGRSIVEKQEKFGWGKSIVEQLANDLQGEYGNTTGYSVQNLWYMRQLFMEYKDYPKLQQLVGEIPWGQNILIMSKIKDNKEREYYLKSTAQMGWSRNVLLNFIKANSYENHLKNPKQHNFKKALPTHLAEQADEAMKSNYNLEFLGIKEPTLERVLENKMIEKVKRLIMELGYGFAFIGNQHKVSLGKKEYFVDLLFYHRKLRCLVAIELKAGGFLPEYAGKMNFYLNLLDEQVKMENENPSIGIILCAEKDHIEVEYALKGIEKPIGVANYQLTKSLPKKLTGQLPSAQELEKHITAELKNNKKANK
jgi:predicted nuclease of restriction endonuclease-like (RecB) superfamily